MLVLFTSLSIPTVGWRSEERILGWRRFYAWSRMGIFSTLVLTAYVYRYMGNSPTDTAAGNRDGVNAPAEGTHSPSER